MAYDRMTEAEARAFLAADPPHTGKLATVRSDGRPHVAPIWFALAQDGSIVFTTGEETQKGRSLRRDPRVSLCVDDERPPFSFVTVEGTVEIVEDLDQVRHWAGVIAGRYMGADRAEEYGARNGVPGELLCLLHPTRFAGAKDVAN